MVKRTPRPMPSRKVDGAEACGLVERDLAYDTSLWGDAGVLVGVEAGEMPLHERDGHAGRWCRGGEGAPTGGVEKGVGEIGPWRREEH